MNKIQLVKDFNEYMNQVLNKYLDEDWHYNVELELLDNEKRGEILLTDSNGMSVLSAFYLDKSEESQDIISGFEKAVINYFSTRTPVDPKTISINYDYDTIVISFKLK